MAICASCGQETPDGFPRCANCGAPLEARPAGREQRKTVTVVFCDVTGSTELGESTDPEALRALLARYFERMKGIVESHGGSVEKFIGDAVMAVFGVPAAHEDDALRACRAAGEMRDAFPELGIAGRIGVNTGEVVTGTDERLATGDAVNVAARLEQAAPPGEVLIAAETLRLVRSAVEVGAERSLELKGKAEAVPAYPLLAVTGQLERRFATRMVGRARELQGLRDAFARVAADRSCQLFTILGSAGVGKSRLAAEFLAGREARLVRGRCLSYGDGITYWPVVEILKQLATLPEGDAARPLRSLLGETGEPASAEEIAWGFRKLLEQEAQLQPLVCVLDDLHWAEETLLDLVEHVADLSRDAPLLLLCMARPELLELRPSWAGGKWNATTVLLEPLDAAETEGLLAELGDVPRELHDRIVQVAEGNPLFLEEMLALVHDSGGVDVEVPPTIQALLAARLDQLDPGERSVLERGSIEGRTFHRGAVAALVDGDGSLDQQLVALVRKELVRPDRAQLAGDDAYRFRHLLIRDAAYDALPKAVRADLHWRFAEWLDGHGQSLVELDEILAYHLEQAARYLDELGRADAELALAARDRLAVAGRNALARGDSRAAVNLLERGVSLAELADDVAGRGELLLNLASALVGAGDLAGAAERAADAAEFARSQGELALELRARCEGGLIRAITDPQFTAEAQIEAGDEAVRALGELGDDAGLAAAWRLVACGENMRANWTKMAAALEQALPHARRAGERQREHEVLRELAMTVYWGPTPVPEALPRCEQMLEQAGDNGQLRAILLMCIAGLHGMEGRFEKARELLDEAESILQDLGNDLFRSAVGFMRGPLELGAGDAAAAEAVLRSNCEALQRMGETGWLSTLAAYLAQALYEQDRLDEAESWVQRAREVGATDDATTQMLWRQAQAMVLARRGEHEPAEQLAQEAVTIVDRTDQWNEHGNVQMTLAEVLRLAGRPEEAAHAAGRAQKFYERKGNLVMTERARAFLASLLPA